MMKRFKKRSDLIKQAMQNVTKRQADERCRELKAVCTTGDFLRDCAMKLRVLR